MIISHWCKLIEGFQASPLDFYKCIEEAINRRKIPGLARSHVLWPEGGLLSAKRDYLRLSREKLMFDVCASHFGTGFFVSCRLVEKEFPWLLLMALGIVGIFVLVMLWTMLITATNGLLPALGSLAVIVPPLLIGAFVLWVGWRFFGNLLLELDQFLMASPVFGPWYDRVTRRNTYYRIDLILMFQAAVQAAVLEVVDKHLETNNLKPLSELERKPTLSKLLMR